MDREEVKKSFLKDIENHEMIIKLDDDFHRNIVFKRKDSSTYWFGIQTWYNHLCIYGDMGTYVFSRVDDMFCFFRSRDPEELTINPGYWHEKMISDGKYCGSQEFSKELFEQYIKEGFEDFIEGEDLSEEKQKELWEDIDTHVLGCAYDGEHFAYNAAIDFTDDHGNRIFQDFWEHSCKEFTYQFIWCLCAIAWAIQQYDRAVEARATEEKVTMPGGL